ncbi:hypothetical protein RchiOBHm_Chr1g0360941 [Rosa chinensis]|uniref:Uncharacterized protein n=1 Tax=Rosa chinensis TaxID=74649 RepID=A0A2P6SIT9_ROSCH|nr:hypothetical protein RchiOBHm_Chr1g0360941 [Rosa chinensis]
MCYSLVIPMLFFFLNHNVIPTSSTASFALYLKDRHPFTHPKVKTNLHFCNSFKEIAVNPLTSN